MLVTSAAARLTVIEGVPCAGLWIKYRIGVCYKRQLERMGFNSLWIEPKRTPLFLDNNTFVLLRVLLNQQDSLVLCCAVVAGMTPTRMRCGCWRVGQWHMPLASSSWDHVTERAASSQAAPLLPSRCSESGMGPG
jgi:hypothetical protein